MKGCSELIYDRLFMEFFPMDGVDCIQNPCIRARGIPRNQLVVQRDKLYMTVGRGTGHSARFIATNDTAGKVNTEVEEKKTDGGYTVTIRFQFCNPDENVLRLYNAMNYTQFHVLVHFLDIEGKVAQSALVYNGWQGAVMSATEKQGTVMVELEIGNLNGLQRIY